MKPEQISDAAAGDRSTAYHEAGHAVMALLHDRPIQRVSILPDQQRLGHCEVRKGVVRPSEDRLEADMLILLAGPVAESVCVGGYNWQGAGMDLQGIRRLALLRGGREVQAEKLARRMLAKAEHLLQQHGHWKAVELIAAELLRTKTISGRAARHLFEAATRSPI